MKTYDVVALGELLIDFTENGISPQGNPLMEANPGGAPGNVLAMLEKLGHKTAFIGKVGADMFGNQLVQTLTDAGVATAGLIRDEKVHTTLAFVHTAAKAAGALVSFDPNVREPLWNVLSAGETYAVCLREDNCAIGSIGLIPPAQSHTAARPDEMGDVRTEHYTYLTKEQWLQNGIK